MNTIFNKFIPSFFRSDLRNDAEKTKQASYSQPNQTSAAHHPQQRRKETPLIFRLFTPYDLVAKLTGFNKHRDQAYSQLHHARQQFNQLEETFKKNGFPGQTNATHYPPQRRERIPFLARLFTPYDLAARLTGFDKFRDQAYSQLHHARHQFNQLEEMFKNSGFSSPFMQHPPFNFSAYSAAYINPNFHPPIRFSNHPIMINSSMGNNISKTDMRGMVEELHKGGLSHKQLRELAEDLKTLRENIGGTDVNNEIVNSLKQKYRHVFLLQSESDLHSPVFDKMIPAINKFLGKDGNKGN